MRVICLNSRFRENVFRLKVVSCPTRMALSRWLRALVKYPMHTSHKVVMMLMAGVTALATAVAAPGPAGATTRPIPASAGHVLRNHRYVSAPTTADCKAKSGIACYSPNQIRAAYDVAPLYRLGDTGKGRTIAIVDAFGSPTIAADLKTFDAEFGLPAPPSLKVIAPAGAIPPYDNSNDRQGWAFETSLDVEYAHAIAPGANILLVETPVSETEGVQGFPEIVKAENYVIDHNMADVITQSFGATEQTFPTAQSLLKLRSAFKNAAAHHVTVLGSSGDAGATDAKFDGVTLYPYPVNSWPSSDPLVTSVGGTQLFLDAAGKRTSPDVVWNDGYGAGGGGLSSIFSRPSFQNGVRKVVGSHRGTPDISLSAAVDGGVLVYTSAFGAGTQGYYIVGGTSEASPLFAGVIALTTQLAHRRIGDINPLLYGLGQIPKLAGLVDVTSGDNSFAGVTGYPATKGYDLSSGWGTVDAARFVPALALGSVLLHRNGVTAVQ